jgi:hypothetical protein
MKLQSAMEFLTTYGWAILVITIVLAAVFLGGYFSQGSYIGPATCTISGGFACSVMHIETNGLVTVVLSQDTSDAINLTAFTCDQNDSFKNFQYPGGVPNTPVYLPIGGNYTIYVQCYNNYGSPFNGIIGTPFIGYLVVRYHDAVTALQSTVSGKVVGKIDAR